MDNDSVMTENEWREVVVPAIHRLRDGGMLAVTVIGVQPDGTEWSYVGMPTLTDEDSEDGSAGSAYWKLWYALTEAHRKAWGNAIGDAVKKWKEELLNAEAEVMAAKKAQVKSEDGKK